jgi:Nif-specific regulatory protein
MAGEREAALKQAEDVLRTAEEARHSNAAARALEVIAMVRLQNFEPALSLAASRAALDHLGTQTTELRASVLHMFFMASSRLGHAGIDEAFLEARQIAVTLELHYQETMLLLAMAMHAELSRNFDREEALLLEASSVARDGASVLWFRWITYQIGRLNLLRGRYDRALESLRAAEELALYSGDASLAANFAEATVLALVHCGRAIEGAALARSWIDGGLLHKSEGQLTATRVTCAEALLATQDAPAASIRTMMDAVTTRLPKASVPIRLVAMANEIEFLHRVSPETDASTWVTAIDELRSDAKVPLNLFVSVRLDLTCADESLRRGRFADGAARASRVLETCSAECLPLAAAQASFVLAECLNGIGKSIEAGDAVNSGAALLNSAAERITDADLRRDFLDQKSVRTLSSRAPKPTEARRLEALYDMIRALNSETDPEALLVASLEMSMKAVGAERGMILISGPTGSDFSVRLAKNLEKETEADAEAFSRRIVLQAERGESVLALDAGQDDRFKEFKSVSLFRIRSLMCVPLRSHGKIIGTVYLDSRRQGRPFTREDLRFVEAFADHAALALENARRRAELEAENKRLKAVAGERASYANIVGRSPAMQRVFDLLERIASSETTVLIQGESGTGKELVARAIHFNGPRKDKAFLSENCAAIAETLLESELFGHVKGAFTGADKDRAGVFEQSHGGTLFLDEVGDMSQAMQARLLRVLQDGELRRVGGDRSIKVDVRVIAATNKDLQIEVAAGRFREDLYYRLAVIPVNLPPLRERVGDVPFIASHLLEQIAGARNRPKPHLDGAVFDALERYAWPGNVRQLENLLRRMALLAGDGPIDRSVIDSDSELARMLFGKESAAGPMLSLEKTEQEQIRRALDAAAGNRDRAARLLGISRATIYRKMREYDLR